MVVQALVLSIAPSHGVRIFGETKLKVLEVVSCSVGPKVDFILDEHEPNGVGLNPSR